MEQIIISDKIPHVGELIFKYSSNQALLQYRLVSKFCKELAETVLIKRWKRHFENGWYVGPEHIPALKFLLNQPEYKDIEINAKDAYGRTAFMKACINGQLEVVKVMLESSEFSRRRGIVLNVRDNGRKTAFIWACCIGHPQVVKLLLDHSRTKNIDLNVEDRRGCTGLKLACQNRRNVGLVDLILNHEALVRIDLRNFTPNNIIRWNVSPAITTLILAARAKQMNLPEEPALSLPDLMLLNAQDQIIPIAPQAADEDEALQAALQMLNWDENMENADHAMEAEVLADETDLPDLPNWGDIMQNAMQAHQATVAGLGALPNLNLHYQQLVADIPGAAQILNDLNPSQLQAMLQDLMQAAQGQMLNGNFD